MTPSRWVRRGGTLQDGAAMREARVHRKLNRPQAAALIGCHPKALAHLEQETRGASDVMLQRVADAYGMKPADIRKRKTQAPAGARGRKVA
jgi:transcriptional regulator with XRE-family HTH domain